MEINGQPLVSVTATVQRVPLQITAGYTLINEGDGLIAYRHETNADVLPDTLAGASEAALRAVGGAIVYAGEKAFIARGTSYIEVACITGETATLRLEPADMVGNPSDADIAESIAAGGLVYSTVAITEAVAGIADLGVGASGEAVRLHKLVLTMRGQGTVAVSYDDDGAATNAVALTGAISLGAGGGILDDFGTDPREALTTIADKHMTVTFVTAGGDGWAVISKGPA
jgi:hypothetical protein